MSCATTDAYFASKIEDLKAALDAALEAQVKILSGAIQTYSIDTGQDKQSVTKLNATELRNYIDALFNQIATLEARLNGCGTIIAGPAW